MLQRLQHMLDIESLTAEQITFILDQSKPFQEFQRHPLKKLATLRGKTVAVAFFEASTRTRISFTTAASRLGADTMNLQAEVVQPEKGRIADRHGANARGDAAGRHRDAPQLLGRRRICGRAAGNSGDERGDGTHEHPTQALLDALTIRDRKQKLEGWNVTILGDILHSRVARSNIHLLGKFGCADHAVRAGHVDSARIGKPGAQSAADAPH